MSAGADAGQESVTERPLIAVLAGGSSQRMGKDKAAIRIAGRTMLDWVLDAAARAGEPIVIGRDHARPGVVAVPDDPGGLRGPAAGLATALRIAAGRPVVLVATDQPWVRPGTLVELAARLDLVPVVPIDAGHLQVTCAAYPGGFAVPAPAAGDGSIRALLDGADRVRRSEWSGWGEDGRSWWSVDSPDHLDEGLRRYGDPAA